MWSNSVLRVMVCVESNSVCGGCHLSTPSPTQLRHKQPYITEHQPITPSSSTTPREPTPSKITSSSSTSLTIISPGIVAVMVAPEENKVHGR